MIKIAITADLHFRAKGLEDIRAGWHELIDNIIHNNVNYLIIGGDIFDHFNIAGREASFGTVLDAFTEGLKKFLAQNGKVIVIPGNHDIAGPNQKDALVALEPLARVVREPSGYLLHEDVYLRLLPWLNHTDLSYDQLVPWVTTRGVNILIGHCDVAGTKINAHHTMIGGQFELPKSAFENKGYDYIGLGHIHKRMDYYIGAPWQLSFGDEDNPAGFVLLEVENGRLNQSWVELNKAPRYHTITKTSTKNLETIPKVDYVKVKYKDELPHISRQDKVVFEKEPEQNIIRPRTSLTLNSSLGEMLKEWMALSGIDKVSLNDLLATIKKDGLLPQNTTNPVGSIQYIKRIGLSNIGPHISTNIPLNGEKFIAISGNNGAGKTFVLDAIFAAFFGEFPSRPGSISNYITPGSDGSAMIDLDFVSKGTTYQIHRVITRKVNKAFLFEGKNVLAGPKITDFDREIGKIAGSREIMLSSVFSAQKGRGDIVDANPSERKEILASLLGINHFAEMAELTKVKMQGVSLEYQANEQRIQEINENNLPEQIRKEKGLIQNYQDELISLEKLQKTYVSTLKDTEQRGQELSKILGKAEELVKYATETEKEIDTLKKEVADVSCKIEETKGHIKEEYALREKIRHIEKTKKEYALLQKQNEEHVRVKEQLLTVQKESSTANEVIERERRDLESSVSGLETELNSHIKIHSAQLGSLRQKLETCDKSTESLRKAGCKDNPLPCPFIDHAADAVKETEKIKADIIAGEDRHQKRQAELQARIRELRTCLQNENYAIDARKQLAGLKAKEEGLRKQCDSHDQTAKTDQLEGIIESEPDIVKKLNHIEVKKSLLVNYEKDLKTHNDAKTKAMTKLQEIKKELEKHRNTQREYDELKDTWTRTSKQKEENENKMVTLKSAIAVSKEKIQRYEDELFTLKKLISSQEQTKQKLVIYETLLQAFGKNGIPQLLIDSALPQLQDIQNHLLGELDNKFTISLKTQTETKSNRVRETLAIIVGDSYGERDILDFSGGEQKLLKSLIRIAIAVFQAQRANNKYEILAIDEAFDALDYENSIKIIQILSKLQESFRQIFLVSHTDSLLCEFPARINLTRTHRGSDYSLIAN